MEIDEPVEVELSTDGAPVRFRWRGVVYGVVSTPEPWLGRRPWWHTDGRAPRGHARTIDRELWRVDAVPLQAVRNPGESSFDLTRAADGAWRLDRGWHDTFDEQLIA